MANDVVMGLDEIEVENTPIEVIDSEYVFLMFDGIDTSGSMSQYVSVMNTELGVFKNALLNSKEGSEILIARADFNSQINIGGYKPVVDFDTSYSAQGGTALYDVICEGKQKLLDYMQYLKAEGMRVKAVFSIFSDGDDTTSSKTISDAKKAVEELNKAEVITAFYGFGSMAEGIAKSLGFANIMETGSTESELRKGFACQSKSVIEASKSVVATTDSFFTM